MRIVAVLIVALIFSFAVVLRSFTVVPTLDVDDVSFEALRPIVDASIVDAAEAPTLGAAASCRVLELVWGSMSFEVASNENARHTMLYSQIGAPTSDADLLGKVKVPRRGKETPGIFRKIKVLCVMYSEGKSSSEGAIVRAKAMWLEACDHYFVISAEKQPPNVPINHFHQVKIVEEKAENMFPRLSQTLHFLADSGDIDAYDYVLFTSDDSVVVPSNLRLALQSGEVDVINRLGAPLSLGHRMITGDMVPFTSNAAFLVNKQLVKMLHTMLPDAKCSANHQGGSEDLFFSKCLIAFGIGPLSIEDIFGEERVHLLDLSSLKGGTKGITWYTDYHRNAPLPEGYNTISSLSFHFHSVTSDEGFSPFRKHFM